MSLNSVWVLYYANRILNACSKKYILFRKCAMFLNSVWVLYYAHRILRACYSNIYKIYNCYNINIRKKMRGAGNGT